MTQNTNEPEQPIETLTDMAPEEFEEARVEPWLAKILVKLKVKTIEATFSGGGDEGGIDDIIFTMHEGAEMTDSQVHDYLDERKLRSATTYAPSLLDKLIERVEEDAGRLGNYSDNEGGSAWLQLMVNANGAVITGEEFTPGSFDDDEEYELDEEGYSQP